MLEKDIYALYDITEEEGVFKAKGKRSFNAAEYSRFKYGSISAGRKFGFELGAGLIEDQPDFLEERELVVISSAHKYVPKATYPVSRYLSDALNFHLLEKGARPSSHSKIHRESLVAGDYGTLSHEDRQKIMENSRMYLDPRLLDGRNVIVVDDVRITGTQEKGIRDLLKDIDLFSALYVYIVSMDVEVAKKDPKVESRLNHAQVKTLEALSCLISAKDFLLNARVCKFILTWNDKKELEFFFQAQQDDFLYELYAGIVGDELIGMPEYQETIQLLKVELDKRKVIS